MTSSPVSPTARDIAAAVAAGDETAVTVVAGALDRIRSLDDPIEAFRLVRADAALAEAAAIDARADRANLPLAGVPVAIKDNVAVSGETNPLGSSATSEAPQPVDHPVVPRIS